MFVDYPTSFSQPFRYSLHIFFKITANDCEGSTILLTSDHGKINEYLLDFSGPPTQLISFEIPIISESPINTIPDHFHLYFEEQDTGKVLDEAFVYTQLSYRFPPQLPIVHHYKPTPAIIDSLAKVTFHLGRGMDTNSIKIAIENMKVIDEGNWNIYFGNFCAISDSVR